MITCGAPARTPLGGEPRKRETAPTVMVGASWLVRGVAGAGLPQGVLDAGEVR